MRTAASDANRAKQAERLVAQQFRRAGWKVERPKGQKSIGFLARRGNHVHAVEVKAVSEGRRDRLVPLLAQAVLQAQAYARQSSSPVLPMAVVVAPRISLPVAAAVREFAQNYASAISVGLMDLEGYSEFIGHGFESLNKSVFRPASPKPLHARPVPDLFSDLNQWMLKVLLAPEIPDSMLSAPRGEYANASQLASAARVSIMSAFRFVQRLRLEGFVDESPGLLRLVRREELFRRWHSRGQGAPREIKLRWLLPHRKSGLDKFLESDMPHRCLALFSAANALGLGFVEGVPEYLYVDRPHAIRWSEYGLSADLRGEVANVIVREPNAPASVFRGAVRSKDRAVSDVIQIWVDVSNHSSRGRAQADIIRRRVLAPVFRVKK